jgi:prepilin-type N-terminal cleavage/methylation domain-containing protein
MDKRSQGFTFVEMIMVMVIISILAVSLMLNTPSSGINLGAQVNQVLNDIRYTQALSMTRNQRFRFVITGSTYQILNAAGTAIILARGNTTATLGTGITFGTLTNLPSSLVNFDGYGTPYTTAASPGTALATAATIPLKAGTLTMTIGITPLTGRAAIQ